MLTALEKHEHAQQVRAARLRAAGLLGDHETLHGEIHAAGLRSERCYRHAVCLPYLLKAWREARDGLARIDQEVLLGHTLVATALAEFEDAERREAKS